MCWQSSKTSLSICVYIIACVARPVGEDRVCANVQIKHITHSHKKNEMLCLTFTIDAHSMSRDLEKNYYEHTDCTGWYNLI